MVTGMGGGFWVGELVVGWVKFFVREGPELRDGCPLCRSSSWGARCGMWARVGKGEGQQWVGG